MPESCLVVGYDGSAPSRAALRYAARRAGREGDRLVVACVHARPPGDLNPKATAALLAEHADEAKHCLRELADAPLAELERISWTVVAEPGQTPAAGLMQVAAREDAAAIVVATHGRGRVASLLGSVAHDLLREARVPVVAIPPRAVEMLEREAVT